MTVRAVTSTAKIRIDQLLVDRGLADSREKAQALILAGQVLVNGQKALKPGHSVAMESPVEVLERMPYVSRGGSKLAGALDHWALDVSGFACVDVEEFPLQALLRLRPELQGKPVAVLDGEPPFEQVCSLNAAARTLGIALGMTRLEMEMFPSALILPRDCPRETRILRLLLRTKPGRGGGGGDLGRPAARWVCLARCLAWRCVIHYPVRACAWANPS